MNLLAQKFTQSAGALLERQRQTLRRHVKPAPSPLSRVYLTALPPAVSKVVFCEGISMEMKMKLAALPALVLAAAVTPAFAVDPATALEAVGTLSTSAAGFGPVMFGIAVVSVGILIGIKGIKRTRGAA